MMKAVHAAAVAAVLCGTFAGAAFAEDMDGAQGAGVQIGYAMPGGDASDFAKAGPVIGLHYMRGLPNNFGVVGAVDSYMFGKKAGVEYSNTALSVIGLYNIPAEGLPFMPYAKFGLSHNITEGKTAAGSTDKSGLGIIIGLGGMTKINDQWNAGLGVSYRTFPEISGNSANAIVIGGHATYNFGK